MNRRRSLLLGAFGIALLALGFYRSTTYFSKTGMVDFRNRVVAARVAETGENPYLFKWSPEFPETLLDPSDEPTAKFSRLTSPPTTLYFHQLFSNLPYSTQKSANFALNWIALLAIAALIAFRLRTPLAPVVFGTGAYAVSNFWLFHVERGQQYIYLVLFLALAALPLNAASGRFFQALAVYFRPTLFIAALASTREKTPWRGLALTAGIGILLLIPAFVKYPLAWWMDYFASARDWYAHHWGTHAHLASPFTGAYPTAPEGDPTLSVAWDFGVRGSLFQHYAGKLGWIPSYEFGLALTAALTSGAAWKLWKHRREASANFLARFFSAIYLIDYFLPSPRSGYNAVLFFPVVLLAAIELTNSRRNRIAFTILIGIVLNSPLSELLLLVGAGSVLIKASSAFQDPGLLPSSQTRP